jgi:hypothetical protein
MFELFERKLEQLRQRPELRSMDDVRPWHLREQFAIGDG